MNTENRVDVLGPDSVKGEGYAWEGAISKTWEGLTDTTGGRGLAEAVEEAAAAQSLAVQRRKGLLISLLAGGLNKGCGDGGTRSVKRGLIRHLVLVLDFSESLKEKDLHPTRVELMCAEVDQFIASYFEVNPLSHLGLIGTKDGLAFPIATISSSPLPLSQVIRRHKIQGVDACGGEPSFGNALDLVHSLLKHVPSYSTRECCFITSSLTSLDPVPGFPSTIEQAVNSKIRVSIISLSAEVYICRQMCKATGGSFEVIMDEHHFRQCLLQLVYPPPLHQNDIQGLIQMGFGETKQWDHPVLCACHSLPRLKTHQCPRCENVVCALPSECPICGLVLANAPALAKSYHHLFPVAMFTERRLRPDEHSTCTGCLSSITRNTYTCTKCQSQFCIDCDVCIHDALFNCPGCI